VRSRRTQSLKVDLDVVYQHYDAVETFKRPGTNEDGSVCRDIYMKAEPMGLRTYRSRVTGKAWNPASYPGPTLRPKIGDTLDLNFSSSLSTTSGGNANGTTGHMCAEGSPAGDVAPNCFHGANDTNIHFHGSHVSPGTNGEPQFTADGKLNPEFRLVDNVYAMAVPTDSGVKFPDPSCEGTECWKYPGDQAPPLRGAFQQEPDPWHALVPRA
jgi:hypothetical protein